MKEYHLTRLRHCRTVPKNKRDRYCKDMENDLPSYCLLFQYVLKCRNNYSNTESCFSIIFRRILRILNMQQIGRNYYNPSDPLNIPQHRLTIWPGYTTTILQYESSIMLCTDVSHKVLRSETVLDFMGNLRQQCGNQRFPEICAKELIGLIVLTKGHRHFLQDIKMRADFNIMKDLSTHTRLTPEQREGRLNRFVSNIQRNADAQAELDKWGLNFDKQLLNLTSRVLPGERIFQGPRSYEYNPRAADLSKEMCGVPLISSPPLNNWLVFHTRRNGNETQSLLQTLNKVSGPLGIRIQRAVMIMYEDHQESLLRAGEKNSELVVLPSNRKDKYDSVKKYLFVDCPTPSQCVVSRTLSRPQALMTVATKIALQMACKMGGELWSVEIPLKQLMIVGIDCYHDTIGGKRSIGALVASLNQSMSRKFSKCVLQHKGQEIMDGLKIALTGALKDYLKFNNSLPSRIIVYRDGVGDGQLQGVVNYEVSQIIDSIKSMGHDYVPKLSVVVVVKKRISSRFFAHINGNFPGMNNVKNGAVLQDRNTCKTDEGNRTDTVLKLYNHSFFCFLLRNSSVKVHLEYITNQILVICV
uniref:Piwi domain-containing protein n=1 Tax=Anabas testudineus TaxID=64144 RepID=A0AAQ6IMX5_ANATE